MMKYVVRFIGAILGALRAEKREIVNRYFVKIHRFDGNARQICSQILDQLWEGDFYRTSLGHFDFFWMRDFGTVAGSLVNLGHRDKVHHTLRWVLKHYRRAGIVKLCIDSFGHTFNAPGKSIDALPWLLHSIVVSDYPLSDSEKHFLSKELKRYVKIYLHKQTGQLRTITFAELRDAVIYDRSAYAVSLVGRLARCAEQLGLENFPYSAELYKQELMEHYWNGRYFNADRRTGAFSAECALFPFYLGIIDDAEMAGKTFDYINEQRLNYPYPLRYTNEPEAFKYHWWMSTIFMPNYAGTSVWSWHGEFYLHLLKRYDRPEYAEQYASFSRMIERHGTFPEMLNPDGSWYNAPVYKGDPGMVWVALFLEL
jgi:hypothetical protein